MKKILQTLVTIVTLLSFPILDFAQAPTLGTTASFVAFSTNGAVVNTGLSLYTGNVGTNNGPITGFGNVNGVMHNGDGATAQAAADLLIAYNQLNVAVPTAFPALPTLGNGDTLTPGVYKIFSTAVLNLDLYLDAKGNPNAVFIFQIQGAFSTNAGSKIKLINGAMACNVFWKVEGVVDMSAATYMRGTVIANNAAINMNTNDTLEGRVLTTTGAISFNGVNTAIPTGCGALILTGPAAPVLASTACYAIFSGNGAVANSGITYVTGDVGTNVTTTIGYDATKVTGTIHLIPDASTALCAADLQNVYNYLNVISTDIELLYPVQFGNNLVLTPHTYLLNSGTVLTGTVYLNAQDNANAVFVIKVNGALSTGTFSKVILQNGAQAKNVFWKVEGAVSINNFSLFTGTLVCNNAAISLATGDTLNGRAFTTSGALSTDAIIATMPPGCNPLPLNWIYFNGKVAQKNVVLEWATTNEINNSFFTIEKSRDGKTFETFTTVKSSAITVNEATHYSYTDEQAYIDGYYRISQTDKDGKRAYYNIIEVKMNNTLNIQHYIQGDYIHVQTSGTAPANASIQLYSIDGRKITEQKIVLTNEANTYKIVKPIHKGIYLIYVESLGQKLYNAKLIVL